MPFINNLHRHIKSIARQVKVFWVDWMRDGTESAYLRAKIAASRLS